MSRILIVEDEAATGLALAESLEDDGHDATHVTSAETAWERLKQGSVDLLITDLRLPGSDGRSLARRALAGRRPLPVIVLTAYGTADVLEELQAFGVHAVFPKPFRVDQIRRTVREALAAAATPRRAAASGGGGGA